MASIHALQRSSQCDTLLESMRSLRPLLGGAPSIGGGHGHDHGHGHGLDHSTYSTPTTTISAEDLDLLDSPTMLNPLDQDMFLLDTSSPGMEIDWNLPSVEIFPVWKPHEFPSLTQNVNDDHPQHHHQQETHDHHERPHQQETHETISDKIQVGNQVRLRWYGERSKEDHTRVRPMASSSSPNETKGSSTISTGSPSLPKSCGLKRPKSAIDLMKQLEHSDAMEDPNGQAPMSKNLVSERRRRKKLNERLYSLRAIVPKISKMDKSSIVGDAISYVQDLQKQVEDVQNDILTLQTGKDAVHEGSSESRSTNEGGGGMDAKFPYQNLGEHKILELDVSNMEENTYQLRIYCKKGPRVLVQLTRALEALNLEIVNANLTLVTDHILNTIVVKVSNDEVLEREELKEMMLEIIPIFGLHF